MNTIVAGIGDFVFNATGYCKPPILALDNAQVRIGLNEFYKSNSPTTVRIKDNSQLQEFQDKVDKEIKYIKPAKKALGYANAVLEGISVTQEGISAGLNGLLNMQHPSAVNSNLPSVILMEEDSIEPTKFSDLVVRFQQIDDVKKPRVIMLANNELDGALKLASTCGDNASTYILTPNGLSAVAPEKLSCTEYTGLVDMFLCEGDGYVSTTNISELLPGSAIEDRFNQCVAAMLQIQSLFRCGQKFNARNQIFGLSNELELIREIISDDQTFDKLLTLKAICNLWIAYLTESNPDRIENTLSIAEHLKDDLLLAHARKLTPMVTGQSTLTHQTLEQAKATFERYGEIEQVLFVENNIIDNNLFSDSIDVERAVKLSNYVNENTPYIRRSTTIHSNCAIALMLCGRITEARERFELAKRSSGPIVNRLATDVNSIIADYIDGETIEAAQIIKIINKIERANIDQNFNYHLASLYGNLWRIGEADCDISTKIIAILRERKFVDYEAYLDNAGQFMRFIAARSFDTNAKEAKPLPGVAGAFIEKHGLKPTSQVFFR